MQMETLEKKDELTNKYLCRIARNIGGGGKRRKKYKHGSSSSISSSSKDDDNSDDKSSKHQTRLLLAAIGLVFPAPVLGYNSFNCSMCHVPVPTLFR